MYKLWCKNRKRAGGKSQTMNEGKNTSFKINSAIQKVLKKEWVPLVVIVIIAVLMADVIGRISKTTSKDNSSKTTTKAATYEAIADTMEFDISDDAIAFINDNPQFFPGNSSNTGAISDHIDFSMDYAHVAKNHLNIPTVLCMYLVKSLIVKS